MLFATLIMSATLSPSELPVPVLRPPSNDKVSQWHETIDQLLLMHGVDMDEVPPSIQDYMISEKLDGVRAFWTGTNLISRQGIEIKVPERIKSALPPLPVHGELWAGRGRFSFVSGLINRDDPSRQEWREVKFGVFDVSISNEGFHERYNRLKDFIDPNTEDSTVFLIPQTTVNNVLELSALFEAITNKGGEGLMLQHRDNLYNPGRTNQLLKYKPTDNMRVSVIGYKQGNGKYYDAVGSLKVRNEQGQEFYVGSGLTDRLREDPPSIGTTVCIEHTGLTTHDLPRFPRFKRVC
ncbi:MULTISPECIES: DNA ligase [Gammaproteobacteria]|uniref:DNA ligase n=1 Tax=Gammaproteobacteria TaxID=1236 RepID=UPI000DCFFD12|nr:MULTISPECIES: DNA ligase [Gammaproteobacteria]RTE87776.1 DNA ligase [Aliidiomarina sp. B3213]TCZ92441.1 DNA ligase [Lysobacter sp. N42]